MSGTMGFYDHFVIALLLITTHILRSTVLVEAQNTNFSFAYFSTPESFLMVDDVQHNAENSSFLMNPMAASLLSSTCGRLLYKDKVRMKDLASGAVASFHTAFTFSISGPNIYSYSNYGFVHADGLAFTFAKNDTFAAQDAGSSLCLLEEEKNGLASNRLFAVEFDTFLNEWWNDPSDSHIGVNVNSMNSTWSHNLCGGKVDNCSYICNGGYFTAWIDYNSTLQKLEVFFANGSLYNNIPKPPKPLINASLSLSELLNDYMYVGFSSSTGLFSEVHQIQSWRFTSSGMPELVAVQPTSPAGVPPSNSPVPVLTNPASNSSNGSKKVGVIAGVSAGAVAALLVLGFFIARYWWKSSHMKHNKFNLVDQNLVPRMFTYKELSKATKNFSTSELLGSGGFGAVYKGTLPSGALVAVKRMKHESELGEESFQAEAASLSHIRHRNLVQLKGWCHEEEQLFLVYDYMRNGSLDEWLFRCSKRKEEGSSNLTEVEALPLKLRHSVLSGVAAALSYLHEECAQCVLHRDIKSSNVLLDGDMNAYLGDFGLARLIDHQKMEKTTLMAGTLGYMAPEMPHTGKATKETDVYSFGVLILEVICGTRPLDVTAIERGEVVLVDRVWRARTAGIILQVADSRLWTTFSPSDTNSSSYGGFESLEAPSNLISSDMPDFDPSATHAQDAAMEDKKTIANLLHLGLLCCNPNPEDRPSMRLVAQLLQSSDCLDISMPSLPECKPQGHFSNLPGISQFAMSPSADSTWSSDVIVQDAAQGSVQSTPPSASPQHASMLTSFTAPDSSLFPGR